MKEEDDPALRSIVRQIANGEAVDWKSPSASEPALHGLRVIETIHRLAQSERREIAELAKERPVRPTASHTNTPREIKAIARDSTWGPLHLIEKIGQGSYGEVFRAHDPALQIDVAVKLWFPQWSSTPDIEGFLQEARSLARIRHPNVVAVLGAAEHGHRVGMWMELLAGETLEASLKSRGFYGAAEAALVGAELSRALAAVHGGGLVHRDVKTRNVMRVDGGRIVLMDFGSVTHVSRLASTARDLSPAGTPLTMAPEQLTGKPVGPHADLYSLGVLLYRLVSGHYPIEATSLEELIERHARGQRTPLRDWCPDLPFGFIQLVDRALAADPAERFPSAGAFEQALLGFVQSTDNSSPPQDVVSHSREPGKAIPNNLPRQRTQFIGRETELIECARLLESTRLLTMTGIGGCGKTRLSLKLAENLLESFPDGVWFVDLAPLKEAERVTLTVATAMGVRESAGTPLNETLVRHLGNQRTLIVLDNCEHVIEAAAELADTLLGRSSDLKLIVTSREGLGIAGELLFALRSLSVPPAGSDGTGIESSEAVRLFVDRAQVVDVRFGLNDKTARAVADICVRLDGIPLAIELAAARVKLLSVEEIRARLDDRFRLLTGGSKTALPRHQTLRATIQWSYDQLAEEEQRLFRLLAVFTGGWTLAATTHVAGDGADEFEVLELLGRMVDKSLVVTEHIDGAATRYAMLETVREYAQERLNESGEADLARTRHLDFYVALTAEAYSKLAGPEQGAWLVRLEQEQENLLSAHTWCDRAENGGEKGLRLLGGVFRYWSSRGLFELGYRVTRHALLRKDALGKTVARAFALYAAGGLSYYRGYLAEARDYTEESLSISRALDDRAGSTRALALLGSAAIAEGNRVEARGHLEEALALARELGDRRMLSSALTNLAELHRLEESHDRAVPLYEESLAHQRERGDVENIGVGLLNLSMVEIQRAGLDSARRRLVEAARLAEETGSKWMGQAVLEVTAALASAPGEDSRAARMWGASEAAREKMGYQREPADELFVTRWVARAREALGKDAFAEGEAEGRELSYERALAEVRAWLERRA